MKDIVIRLRKNGITEVISKSIILNQDNLSGQFIFDFTESDIPDWIKIVRFDMADGSNFSTSLGTGDVVTTPVTNAMTVAGTLKISLLATSGESDLRYRPVNFTVEAFTGPWGDLPVPHPDVLVQLIADVGQLEEDLLELSQNVYTKLEVDTKDNAKMDLTGSNSFIDKLMFNTNPSTTPLLNGQMRWNTELRTLQVGMDGGIVVGDMFQEIFYSPTRNDDTVTIQDGQLVMYVGAVGNSGVIRIRRVNTQTLPLVGAVLGVATEDIPVNQIGRITWFGMINGIQTDGANYGESWVDGDLLYNHPTIVGGLSKTRPVAPLPALSVGVVIRANATNGQMFVRPFYFNPLENLSTVYAPVRNNGDVLMFNSVTNRWEVSNLVQELLERIEQLEDKVVYHEGGN